MSNPDDNTTRKVEGDVRKSRATARVERRHRVTLRLIQWAPIENLKARQEGWVDDIRPAVSPPADAGTSCWGAAVLGLSQARIIRELNFVRSSRPERHGCRIGLWTLAVEHAEADRWLAAHQELRGGTDDEPDDGEAGRPPRSPTARRVRHLSMHNFPFPFADDTPIGAALPDGRCLTNGAFQWPNESVSPTSYSIRSGNG